MKKQSPEEKIYFAFYETKKKMLYYNQLKEYTRLSDSSLQNALKKLMEKKETEAIREKANTYYRLKDRNKIKVRFTQFDYGRLESLNPDVKVPLKRFLAQMPDKISFVILFGSGARKQEKRGSDIDLLVVLHSFESEKLQKAYEREMKTTFNLLKEKISATSIYPLSIFYTDVNSYTTADDRVVNEAKNTGLCISGNLEYYGVMLDESSG